MTLDFELRSELDKLTKDHRVVLFMKGSPRAPQCGFSARVVGILDDLIEEYETVDVLSRPEIRNGIKEYSNWPTIPQLYVNGEFVGGCDIVQDLASSGDLREALGVEVPEVEEPSITVTDAAAEAFREHASQTGDEVIRLSISKRIQHDMEVGPRRDGDFVVQSNGITVAIDRVSASRANGLTIDYVKRGLDAGFSMDNPNGPAKVREMTAKELKEAMDAGRVQLFDVRPEEERRIASIEGARPLDTDGQEHLKSLPNDTEIVFHCHQGIRSMEAAEHFRAEGFTRVYNLRGGIDAWSCEVDASVPRY
ncbi:MAG: Grx4 family monothiol glutaredoxin [Polyangiales bacterium]